MPVSRMESSSGGEMPALLNATSTEPYVVVGGREHRLDLVRVRDVAVHVEPAELVGDVRAARVVHVADHHVGALGGEPASRRQPDPAAATGDHGGPPGQPTLGHASSFVIDIQAFHAPVARPTGPGGQVSAMKTFLTSVNASSASGPSSRPMPDCLKPPNGVE